MSDDSRATFTLRASRDLLDRLKEAAESRAHSMNAEIVHRLEESLYLSQAAHLLEGDDLTDIEMSIVHGMRKMTENQQLSLAALVASFSRALTHDPH